jgi:hypothetical protein
MNSDRDRRALQLAEKKARRARLEAELGTRQRALPDKRYGVILADPPWRFEPYSRVTGMDRAADNHYPTSPLAKIKALDVESIAAADCVLFLWATAPCSRKRSRSWRPGALPTKLALCGARTGSELDTGFATSMKFC